MEFEALVVALRPKATGSIPARCIFSLYDVLLVNSPASKPQSVIKELPKKYISFEDEPSDVLFYFVYQLSGAEFGGLKAKRAVFVPQTTSIPKNASVNNRAMKGALYCLPIEEKDALMEDVVEHLEHCPAFFCLDEVLEALKTAAMKFTEQTQVMLRRLENWLVDLHSMPGAIDLLFSSNAEDRLRRSVTNPAYFSENQVSYLPGGTPNNRTMANEALAKMLEIEKCDLSIRNPLYESGMKYKDSVDLVFINRCYGRNLSSITTAGHMSPGERRGSKTWAETYPLHKAACDGDAKSLEKLLQAGYEIDQKDFEGWTPLHYAAWSGQIDTLSILIEFKHPANIKNSNGRTALHVAATNGRYYAVELLLTCPDVDVEIVDKNGKTALDLCEHVDTPDWQEAARLLEEKMHKPVPTINVFLMDGTYRVLKLVRYIDTTVRDLHQQMMKELQLPPSYSSLFTIWICSKNLQLQLKPNHKPMEHINDWKREIVKKLSDHNPDRENPQLFWRRDAINSVEADRKVTHPTALQLLFHEAYHNYITSLYPCVEQDVLILAGVIMHLNLGPYSPGDCKDFFTSESRLKGIVPSVMLRNSRRNWMKEISSQYQFYSESLEHKEKEVTSQDHHRNFLTVCWNLTIYGAAYFTGQIRTTTKRNSPLVNMYIAVNDVGLHLINVNTKVVFQCFTYNVIEWQEKKQGHSLILEVKHRTNITSIPNPLVIHTKQAGLVVNLMNKLHQLPADDN